MASTALYEGSALNQNEKVIRLLEFLPSVNGLLCFKFHTCSVKGDIPFIALSYEWTPSSVPTLLREIIVDGQRLTVRNNLWLALCQIAKDRAAGHSELQDVFTARSSFLDFPWVWLDAVCIDQENTEERNHQVKLMREIYSHAVIVVVWLGPAADDSELAIWHIRARGQLLQYNLGDLESLQTLLSRTYWERLWVLQEFFLAQEILLYCGDKSFWLLDLRNTLDRLTDLEEEPNEIPFHHSSALNSPGSRMVFSRSVFQLDQQNIFGERKNNLVHLILTWRDKQCTDVHDKTFALLSLAYHPSQWHEDNVTPDYNKTMEEVYCDVLETLRVRNFRRNTRSYCLRLMEILKVRESNDMVRIATEKAIHRDEEEDSLRKDRRLQLQSSSIIMSGDIFITLTD